VSSLVVSELFIACDFEEEFVGTSGQRFADNKVQMQKRFERHSGDENRGNFKETCDVVDDFVQEAQFGCDRILQGMQQIFVQ